MIVFPNAKINIGLDILRKRSDGFHDIDSLMFPTGLKDILEIVQAKVSQPVSCAFSQSGILIEGEARDNLCVKAYELLSRHYKLPKVKIHLHKIIPFGAGLGGGSADAAFTLLLLNNLFTLNISKDTLKEYAAQIGSDCPFFVENVPSMVSGRGEVLQPVSVLLSGYFLVLVSPQIHVGTAEAYANVVPEIPNQKLKDLIKLPVKEWKNTIKNDFESSVFNNHPEIAKIKESLYKYGAVYASMSGSGSSVYGLFAEKPGMDFNFGKAFIHQEKI